MSYCCVLCFCIYTFFVNIQVPVNKCFIYLFKYNECFIYLFKYRYNESFIYHVKCSIQFSYAFFIVLNFTPLHVSVDMFGRYHVTDCLFKCFLQVEFITYLYISSQAVREVKVLYSSYKMLVLDLQQNFCILVTFPGFLH